jgi:small subunit ribosomal protein S8
MTMSDPIADLLTRIRNGLQADKEYVDVPASRFKAEIARILQEQGYIEGFSTEPADVGEALRIKLRYTEDRQPIISGISRVSKPGRREYAGGSEIPRVLGGMGTAIMTTSRGVMTGHAARAQGIGGEVVAYVW